MKRNNCLIVAEVGVNHNGSLDLAKQLIDAAAAAGADAVKFQTFDPDSLVSVSSPKAGYQRQTTDAGESQYEMLRKLKLRAQSYRILQQYAKHKGVEFLSTPFDERSVDLLVGLGVRVIKVASGDITHAPLLLHIGRSQREVILSTGMSTLGEIEEALSVLAFGLTDAGQTPPGREAFRTAYASEAGQSSLAAHVTLLHATSEYPTLPGAVNLRAMDTLATAFRLPVGLSDHTEGIAVPIAAVARGAVVIEKHLTLNRNLPGPDHLASLEPVEFQTMVHGVREAEEALGSAAKLPTSEEMTTATVVRRSLVASRPIKAGECFAESNLVVKRPGTGLAPSRYWEVLGQAAKRGYDKDEWIE
ncbi:N-acetylneuraminate synthase [Alicyclobacillus sp. ALC3]|uniref:N-acetylneuraminate synthase n=1 Tax=Alicyclobacillus sp. ALC3 TaxID=2796143 RepID=UPI002377E63D|nr:N-acetylneuraminate synthase [Alicyclobacillus sp. ALC3]WDL95138.1 N-acetylneuraminate synthase [Alicyclobacillus sp. ALC3]